MTSRPVVTRELSSPSRHTAIKEPPTLNHIVLKRNTSGAVTRQSKLIAALDALSLNKNDDDDSEVEIVVEGPTAIKPRGAGTTTKGPSKTKPRLNTTGEPERIAVHPFFHRNTCEALRHSKTKGNTDLKLRSETGRKNMNTDSNNGHSGSTPPLTKQNLKTSNGLRRGASINSATTNANAFGKSETSKTPYVSIMSYSYKDYKPTPTVVYTRHEEEANELIATLKEGPLGFDMEWRVLWTRKANSSEPVAQDRRVAVVQLADTAGMILVIQIYAMSRFPKKLQVRQKRVLIKNALIGDTQEVIENPKIPKLGANILGDGSKLLDDYGILAKNLLELGALVHMADPAGGEFLAGSRSPQWKNIIALAKLVAQYCDRTLEKPKHLRMGNWEAELNTTQVDYAASDAHCAIKIFEQLLERAKLNGIPLTDESIQNRCSSSVPHPYRRLSEFPSSSDLPMEKSRLGTGQVQRFVMRPNLAVATPGHTNGMTSGMRPQHIRAYHLWYKQGMSLEKMCSELRVKINENVKPVSGDNSTMQGDDEDKATVIAGSNSLKPSTVIGYVIGALQTDAMLPFNMDKLRELVQMDGSSWERHHEWLLGVWREGRGIAH